jgi:hypothetical protein
MDVLADRTSSKPLSARVSAVRGELRGGWSGQELEHVARKVDALRYYHSQMSHMFGDDLRLSHRIRVFAAGLPGRHRRYVERVWGPA